MRVACLYFQERTDVKAVAGHCLRFSPQLYLLSGNAIFVEIGKCRKLYTEARFLRAANFLLNRLGLKAHITLANDVTESLVLAKHGAPTFLESPLAALVDVADPFNSNPEVQKSVQKMIRAFQDLGVKTLAEFKALPRNQFPSRFGALGTLCKQRVNFEMMPLWKPWIPDEVFIARDDFEAAYRGELETIYFFTKKHLDELFKKLRLRQLKAEKIRITLLCETTSFDPEPEKTFEVSFYHPQNVTKDALGVIREKLSRELEKNPIKNPVESIQTEILKTCPGTDEQRNMLDQSFEKAEREGALLNRLKERDGEQNIFRAALTEERLPEKSWRKVFDPNEPIAQVDLRDRVPLRHVYSLPPYKLKVDLTQGFVHYGRKRWRIKRIVPGIEKIAGEWFRNEDGELLNKEDRSYFSVEIESGRELRLFETPNGDFFMDGYSG